MPPVPANAAAELPRPARPLPPRPPAELLDAYLAHLERSGRGNSAYASAARTFLARWPQPQAWAALPLAERLEAGKQTRPLVTFLMVAGRLRPGYDYLACRKLSSIWREVTQSPLGADLDRFMAAAAELGFSPRVRTAIASQIVARLLIQTGRGLQALTAADLAELATACRQRGKGWRSYRSALHSTHQVLFHLGILDQPPPPHHVRDPLQRRMAGVAAPLRARFVAYLERKRVTCTAHTVSSLATRLAHFGRFLAEVDPVIGSLAELDRCRHIEPYLVALTQATSRCGGRLSVAEQARRTYAVANFLAEIAEWGWPDAPARRLLHRSDVPRQPQPLPRYLPPDADRRLAEALAAAPPASRLAADACLLQRACGLRVGELLDLELDCVHEVGDQGAWLKVPLGKLDTERMVPLDEETLQLIDRIIARRSPCRPLPHPRTGRPAQFLFTHHGRRLTTRMIAAELDRAGAAAGLGHVTSHQLRHTYATALVNAGCSLQALMALLGHVSATMSLRYGRLFDHTVRTEYERALTLAKQQLGPLPALNGGPHRGESGPAMPPILGPGHADADWRDAPAIKARLAGGFCLRAPAQGACPYANICEHCPNFRTDPSYLPVLAAQRVDAEALARDAQARGWISEAERHRQLIARLDAVIGHAQDQAQAD
jgi:integrase